MTTSDRKTKRVGIFGGTFNPPHVAHLVIAELVREQFDLDTILWVPNYQSPLKEEHELASVEDRLAMTYAATSDNEAFRVSEIEIRREGLSYTVDTVAALQERHPDHDFRLIVGSDSLADLEAWHRPDELLRRVPIIVFRRPGFSGSAAPGGLDGRISFAEAPLLEISGTEIRKRIRSGRSIRYMITEPVREYIASRGLYR